MVLIKVRQPIIHEDVARKRLVESELDSTFARLGRVVVSDFVSAGSVRNHQLMTDWIDFLAASVINNVFGNLKR